MRRKKRGMEEMKRRRRRKEEEEEAATGGGTRRTRRQKEEEERRRKRGGEERRRRGREEEEREEEAERGEKEEGPAGCLDIPTKSLAFGWVEAVPEALGFTPLNTRSLLHLAAPAGQSLREREEGPDRFSLLGAALRALRVKTVDSSFFGMFPKQTESG